MRSEEKGVLEVVIPPIAVDSRAVAAHYDDLDDLYRDFWGTSLHHGYWSTGNESAEEAIINLTRLVARQAALKPGDRVCDLGCGYGAAALLWRREYGARVIGVTISEKQFRFAQANAAAVGEVQFILGDALENGFDATSFDAVTAVESSEHMVDKQKFFREVYRLLRPGGRCVVAAWLSSARPRKWHRRRLLEPICVEGRLPGLASADEYRDLLARAGFHAVEYLDLTSQVKKTWTICARRFLRRWTTDPALRRRLRDPAFANAIFAKTVFRIWLAYRVGAMGFGLFTVSK
ncbi:MAG TPA: class I SAM-dependent methyltransferase [Terriglobales bacterium]|nr:class I SAM-dependent methyltransferase [Terriglobales bacterium]